MSQAREIGEMEKKTFYGKIDKAKMRPDETSKNTNELTTKQKQKKKKLKQRLLSFWKY